MGYQIIDNNILRSNKTHLDFLLENYSIDINNYYGIIYINNNYNKFQYLLISDFDLIIIDLENINRFNSYYKTNIKFYKISDIKNINITDGELDKYKDIKFTLNINCSDNLSFSNEENNQDQPYYDNSSRKALLDFSKELIKKWNQLRSKTNE